MKPEEIEIGENKPKFVIVELSQLENVLKTIFMNDLDKMNIANMTLYVENFHLVVIRYRPKRKYFFQKGFPRRPMLAILSYNENLEAEIRGERRVSIVYQSFSKAKGEKITKVKKSPSSEEWKRVIVHKAIKRQYLESSNLGLNGLSAF